MIFPGRSSKSIATKVANKLKLKMGRSDILNHLDGEINVKIFENVSSKEVFIFQSISPPVNDNLMELCLISDALRRGSARNIIAVIPYMGYMRQNRSFIYPREPISSKLIADLLQSAGISRILTIAMHSNEIQGNFSIPIDDIYNNNTVLTDLKDLSSTSQYAIVSPDIGGIKRARSVAEYFPDAEFVVINKKRHSKSSVSTLDIIGCAADKDCLIIDDIVDSGNTLCSAAKALKKNHARSVRAYATHAVLSGSAIEQINDSDLDELIISDTIEFCEDKLRQYKKIKQRTVVDIIVKAIAEII